jgi:hypothetical protein
MPTKVPTDIPQYREWLIREHRCEVSAITQGHYEAVRDKVFQDFQNSQFWRELTGQWQRFDEEYWLRTAYHLFMERNPPALVKKEFPSFLLKTFRRNCLENREWDNPPRGGWWLPDRCHANINDMVRTTIVVKYLDGVEWLWGKIEPLARRHGIQARIYYEARPEGYYGAHVYLRQQTEVPALGSGTEKHEFQIEMQITTQLKEVIKELAHKYYEERRVKVVTPVDRKWQWDHRCEEFVPNYLGHLIHYIEGMILQVRERQEEKK